MPSKSLSADSEIPCAMLLAHGAGGCLLADYARTRKATVLVKGLRAVSDFEYEFQMSLTNKKLNPELETVFLTTSAENMYLSSSIVKQIAMFGGDISDFVPACILKDIQDRLCK